MKNKMFVVTGAPAAGKTSALGSFLSLQTRYIAFDIDWLAKPATELAGKSINFDQTTWKPYSRVWFAVLESIYKNGRTPVLFAPFDKDDMAVYGLPDWCSSVEWFLLDCDDSIRKHRLAERDWPDERIEEALSDALKLRNTIEHSADTAKFDSKQVAHEISGWLKSFER